MDSSTAGSQGILCVLVNALDNLPPCIGQTIAHDRQMVPKIFCYVLLCVQLEVGEC